MRFYKFLGEVLHKIRSIENTLKVPRKSQLDIEDTIEQMCLLAEIRHEIIPHDVIKESLADNLGNNKSASTPQLKLIEGIHKSNSAILVDLVKSLFKAKIECQLRSQ